MIVSGWVLLGLLAGLVLGVVMTYNRMVRLRNAIGNAFAQIDVQLKRRYDLIPNLLETARHYVQHERETLEAVIAARGRAIGAATEARAHVADASATASMAALGAAEAALGGALGRLMALVEAYPELKADQNLREFAEELSSTENRIGFARQAYNDAVLDYNNAAQQFPANLVAGVFSFMPAAMLQSTQSASERAAPAVRF